MSTPYNGDRRQDADKVLAGFEEALGVAKGILDGVKITHYSATEFFLGGFRYPAGTYEIRRIGEAPSCQEPEF